MDIELVLKVIGAVAAVFGVGRALYEIISGNKPKLRDEYKFARDFLDDLSTKKDLHPFVIEKGYHAIAGTTAIKGEEVAYILTLENSARCLRDFVLARKYIEHINTTGDLQIAFSGKYKSAWSRRWRKYIYVTGYSVFAFAALSPLLLNGPMAINAKAMFALLAFTLPVFGLLAWNSLQSFVQIYRGEKLVENQQKHTKRIILPSSVARKIA